MAQVERQLSRRRAQRLVHRAAPIRIERPDRSERDHAQHDVTVRIENRRAEAEIQGLARKMNLLGEKIEDLEDLLRNRHSA